MSESQILQKTHKWILEIFLQSVKHADITVPYKCESCSFLFNVLGPGVHVLYVGITFWVI